MYMALYGVYYVYGVARSYLQPHFGIRPDVSEIKNNLFVGDVATAYDLEKLKELGITHIISAVPGLNFAFPDEFVYMYVPVVDSINDNIEPYLNECADYVHDVLENTKNRILIHCICGVSRSTTLTIAYLIKYHGMSYPDALMFVKTRRLQTEPNDIFKLQLQEFAKTPFL